MSVHRATHHAGNVQARPSNWQRFAGMVHRPRMVFEDLREHPSWLSPAVSATLAGTVHAGVYLISTLLRSSRDDPDPAAYFVRIVHDLSSYGLWSVVLAPVIALE